MAKQKHLKILAFIAVLMLLSSVSSCGAKKLSPQKYMSFGDSGGYSVDWDRLTKDLGGSKRVFGFFEEHYPLLMPDTATPENMSAQWLFDVYAGCSEPADRDTYLQYYTFRPHWSQMDEGEIEEWFGIRLEPYIRKEHYQERGKYEEKDEQDPS